MIEHIPTAGLLTQPTPLHALPNLSQYLGGPSLYIKRDDLTGLGFGGNKVRKLDYLMADILRRGYDHIVTGAYFQSNWCTAVTAAANRFGLKTVLVKRGPAGYVPTQYEGNHLLHVMLGAEIIVAEGKTDADVKHAVVQRLRDAGHNPVLVNVGGSEPLGVLGYVSGVRELVQQASERGLRLDYLVHASGSGGTQAGTVIGAKAFGDGLHVVCSSTGSRSQQVGTALVRSLIDATIEEYALPVTVADDEIELYDQYAHGYGHATPAKLEAVALLARLEGLFIDPVYTASAMACLIDQCRQGRFKVGQNVVFLHTGGQAAIFPYEPVIRNQLAGEPLAWQVPPWDPAG